MIFKRIYVWAIFYLEPLLQFPVPQWIRKGVHPSVIPIYLTKLLQENWYADEYLLPSLCRWVLMDPDSCVAIIDVFVKHNESEITPQQ